MAIMLPNGMCAPPVYNHPNDLLAKIIADAWADPKIEKALLKTPDKVLAKRGIYIDHPVVITEANHNKGYRMKREDEIVFVLPKKPRNASGDSDELLETAKVKMAYTPCGI